MSYAVGKNIAAPGVVCREPFGARPRLACALLCSFCVCRCVCRRVGRSLIIWSPRAMEMRNKQGKEHTQKQRPQHSKKQTRAGPRRIPLCGGRSGDDDASFFLFCLQRYFGPGVVYRKSFAKIFRPRGTVRRKLFAKIFRPRVVCREPFAKVFRLRGSFVVNSLQTCSGPGW